MAKLFSGIPKGPEKRPVKRPGKTLCPVGKSGYTRKGVEGRGKRKEERRVQKK
jgi:hypothetical protein